MEKGIEMSRMAVQTNYFPLWEAVDGKLKFTRRVKKPKPLEGLLKLQKRFSHLSEEELKLLQQVVDKRLALLESLASE
ncbi:MAG: hypothetical protein JRJ51_13920 [Deltaproteobacteria bacterium]|nr:hypothetical protein [Deltaproteobacteria bacterium]